MKDESIIRDCHYCEYGACENDKSEVDCYVDDGGYFDHSVEDSKEAEECEWFIFCNVFPRF